MKKNPPKISNLPPYTNVIKYQRLIDSGYTEERALLLSKSLVQDGEETEVDNLGYDENSAKLVVQEIAHDRSIKPDTRLKAAETMLSTLGVLKPKGTSDQVALTLAEILQEIYRNSEGKPKVLTVKEVRMVE